MSKFRLKIYLILILASILYRSLQNDLDGVILSILVLPLCLYGIFKSGE